MSRTSIELDDHTLTAATDLLRDGESLQGFIDLAVLHEVVSRQKKADFLLRAKKAAEIARASGRYRSSDEVISMLENILKSRESKAP